MNTCPTHLRVPGTVGEGPVLPPRSRDAAAQGGGGPRSRGTRGISDGGQTGRHKDDCEQQARGGDRRAPRRPPWGRIFLVFFSFSNFNRGPTLFFFLGSSRGGCALGPRKSCLCHGHTTTPTTQATDVITPSQAHQDATRARPKVCFQCSGWKKK